jgi:hypothetical protein
VIFESTWALPVSVFGSITGQRYHFQRAGDRVLVDVRDRRSLASSPHLREVLPR